MGTEVKPKIVNHSSHALVSTELERTMEFQSDRPGDYRPDLRICHCAGTAERVMNCLQGTAVPTPSTGNKKLDAFVDELRQARVKCATDGIDRFAQKGNRVEKKY